MTACERTNCGISSRRSMISSSAPDSTRAIDGMFSRWIKSGFQPVPTTAPVGGAPRADCFEGGRSSLTLLVSHADGVTDRGRTLLVASGIVSSSMMVSTSLRSRVRLMLPMMRRPTQAPIAPTANSPTLALRAGTHN